MHFKHKYISNLDIIALSLCLPGVNVDFSQQCFELDLKVSTIVSLKVFGYKNVIIHV